MRSILVGEVRTGRRITQIPVSDASWSVKHRATGEISIDIPLDADEFRTFERAYYGGLYPGPGVFPSDFTFPESATPIWKPTGGLRAEFLSAIEPARCFLAVLEGDYVIEAGPIWSWEFPFGGKLTVKARGMRSLFEHRYVMGNLASAWAEWAQTYSNLSLATIAKRLVQLTESVSGGDLPIVLPADEAGVNTRTYLGSDLSTVLSRLDDLSDVIGGPDIAFEPRLTADRMGVEWVMRTGTAADPLLHQTGDDHVWDSRVPAGGVSGLSVSRDATGVAQQAWVTGGGADEALLMARRTPAQIGAPDLRNYGFPLLETSDARSTVSEQATLDKWAEGNLSAALRPTQTWKMSALAAPTDRQGTPAGPQLGAYRPGDWAKVWVPKTHPLLGLLLPEGFHRARVLNISGGLDEFVKIDLMPTMEVR
ncbi:hypothetical protein MHY85_05095 [Cellulomonas sp. ACRRI]|uniref:hypothetical protein n=1 Tax=Cellulomonas sp. ACRRI TaxID=2918188 RepID=UPI001EF2E917|nr:hypothetical protein [Cellulomonas sp. ACRRI]MCG7285351.1 hypothetical protein [Cellulomonas sp. ACRRI]